MYLIILNFIEFLSSVAMWPSTGQLLTVRAINLNFLELSVSGPTFILIFLLYVEGLMSLDDFSCSTDPLKYKILANHHRYYISLYLSIQCIFSFSFSHPEAAFLILSWLQLFFTRNFCNLFLTLYFAQNSAKNWLAAAKDLLQQQETKHRAWVLEGIISNY